MSKKDVTLSLKSYVLLLINWNGRKLPEIVGVVYRFFTEKYTNNKRGELFEIKEKNII